MKECMDHPHVGRALPAMVWTHGFVHERRALPALRDAALGVARSDVRRSAPCVR